MSLVDVGAVIGGLILLVAGAEALVRAAGTLARRAGISSLVVGLTIVSLATSTPELAVSVDAALRGEPDLAVGNIAGSNVANVLLILGVAALIVPLTVKRQLVRLDLPVMVAVSVLLLLLARDGGLSTTDGAVLLAVMAAHTTRTVVLGRRDPEAAPVEEVTLLPVWQALLALVAGVAVLVGGARLLVDGAVGIATALGLSSLVIGLTVVAVGTSLPELAAAISAVRQGDRDMAVGNAVGSNIANIGLVLGVPAILSPDGLAVTAAATAFDLPAVIVSAVLLMPVAITGLSVQRWEGAVFVGLYAAYLAYIVLAATNHHALTGFTRMMVVFVLPAVSLAVLVSVLHGLRQRKQDHRRAVPLA
ncbi:MAG: sodium:calcium antiporter [Micrococcales bacterium]|nr:MAG: sodium:calcium antiporter [Micrococcales bacterium]PIE26607.1 MAG: sodium:calcium antiporter [Micrococcales bacterium]